MIKKSFKIKNIFSKSKIFSNIIAKIFIFLVLFSFILVGFGDQLSSLFQPWVAKIGSYKITKSQLEKEVAMSRNIILQQVDNQEAVNFVNSDQFKFRVLEEIIDRYLVEKVASDLDIKINKSYLMSKIVDDKSLQNEEGKFDYKKFKKMLATFGFDENKYFTIFGSQISSQIGVRSLLINAPINNQDVINAIKTKKEQRFADLVIIDNNSISEKIKIDEAEIAKYYQDNQSQFQIKETRDIEYIKFPANQIVKNIAVNDQEIADYYQKNQPQFQDSEYRDFYHMMFEKEDEAKKFLDKLTKAPQQDDIQKSFIKIAKEDFKKNKQQIFITAATKDKMMPQIAKDLFSINQNEISKIIKSDIGYHIILVSKIVAAKVKDLNTVKNEIATIISSQKYDKELEQKIAEIEDFSTQNSDLNKVKNNFNIKSSIYNTKINVEDINKKEQAISNLINNNKQNEIFDDKIIEDLKRQNNGAISKIYQIASNKQNHDLNELYLFRIAKIEPTRIKTIEEVKDQIIVAINKQKKIKLTEELVGKIVAELKDKNNDLQNIAKKYKLIVKNNQNIEKFTNLTLQNRSIAYQTPISKTIYSLAINDISEPVKISDEQFIIAKLKTILEYSPTNQDIVAEKEVVIDNFRNEISEQYQKYIARKYPTKFAKELEKESGNDVSNNVSK
jgi:peptidyl-prolyl cis-trans isomerase D